MNSHIKSVGVYHPQISKQNEDFEKVTFLQANGSGFEKSSKEIVETFSKITEIRARTIAKDEVTSSEMGYHAALDAIQKGNIDKETIDYIIFAHNGGDMSNQHNFYDMIPNLAARVKGKLGIMNPDCVGYDILFGCPGWLEAVKQGHLFIKAGGAKRVLVIGADTISRVADSCDIDSMLFSDGAGAIILEETTGINGVLSHKTTSHCQEELGFLKMGPSYNKELADTGFYLKMDGKKVFRHAMENMPKVINACLEEAGLEIGDVQYFLMHQANAKMIKLIGKKLFETHGIKEYDEELMPINVATMGNNSVATIPTLLSELSTKKLNDRGIVAGDVVVFASVGAGMHTNCMIHRF
ncbi:MAG: ketoacyl-ACP synthase III [Saprospiraceae bacterium]|nr:ketoacyl-ACP synthase III [Saprospiraceae bacterium]